MKILCYLCLLLFSFSSLATLPIATQLTSSDMSKMLQILGYGTASKILGDPYPLGGYSGFEVGYSSEVVPTDQLASLGAKTTPQSQMNFNMITVGKGIYNNVDTFIQVALLGQQENITNLGAQLRWTFYQADYLPIYLSFILHGNSFNCENVLLTNSYGTDLIAGFREGDVTLYFGGGPIQANGKFSGGLGGITQDDQTDSAQLQDSRFLAGLNVRFGKMFIAAEIDNYAANADYAAKLGYRF